MVVHYARAVNQRKLAAAILKWEALNNADGGAGRGMAARSMRAGVDPTHTPARAVNAVMRVRRCVRFATERFGDSQDDDVAKVRATLQSWRQTAHMPHRNGAVRRDLPGFKRGRFLLWEWREGSHFAGLLSRLIFAGTPAGSARGTEEQPAT
jgi:hypothetical protein